MRIQHNIMAMNAYRNYTNNVSAMKKNLEKLSSGYKINRAGDDAAGLAISEKMRAQITGLQTAQKNAKDGISLVQTAEGAMTEVHDMLNRMVELATQSANGTYDNTTDRNQMQKEVNQLLDEINRIADSANFNGIKLLDGSLGLNKSAFELSSVEGADAGEVSGIVGNLTASAAAANAVTKLHAAGTSGVKGSFIVYLGQANVGNPGAGKTASINIKIGTAATLTVKASVTNAALTAGKIAKQLLAATTGGGAGAACMYVTKGGTMGFAASTAAAMAAAKAKGLVYTGATGTNGSVVYTLKGFVNAGSSAIVDAAASGSNLTADNVGSKAFIDLNMDVKISAGTGACTYNAANVGTNPKNSVMQKADQLASTELEFDVTQLTQGMKIIIDGVSKTVKMSKSATGDIDLSGLVGTDGKVTAANKAKALDKIAEAFRTGTTNVDVGVNAAGKLTLSEKANAATGKSTAATAAQKKMETLAGFKSLVKVTQDEVKAGANIKVTDPNSLVEGDVLNVTKSDGTTVKLIFTKDAKNTGDEYINFADKTASSVASLIATKVGGTATGDTVKVNGGKALGRGLTLQIGDTADSYNQLNVAVQDMHADSLGLAGLKISDEVSAQNAIDKIKAAINTVSDVRGTLGATQNRLDHTINNLSVMTENIQDAESTIRDVDVAEEMMAYTKNNILIQSAQAMLAQANQIPQGVLQLLG